jgi:anti-anti-sigma factor
MDHDVDFSVSRRLEANASIVVPTGELDLATVPAVREELRLARSGAPLLVLDLREVTFMDSSALRLLVEVQREADDDGCSFVAVRGPASVRRVIELSGLEGRVCMVDDPAQAAGADGRGSP